MPLKTAQSLSIVLADLKRVIGPTGCIERLPKGLSMGETGSVALLRPIFVVTHYWAGNLRTENLRNLYGVEGGTLTKVVASDKQSEPMLDRWISTHAAHEHWITTGRHQGVWHVGYNHACCPPIFTPSNDARRWTFQSEDRLSIERNPHTSFAAASDCRT